jgi:hypothetical protein
MRLFVKRSVPGLLDKKEKEDATFCLRKDDTFFTHFCPTNPTLENAFSDFFQRQKSLG